MNVTVAALLGQTLTLPLIAAVGGGTTEMVIDAAKGREQLGVPADATLTKVKLVLAK